MSAHPDLAARRDVPRLRLRVRQLEAAVGLALIALHRAHTYTCRPEPAELRYLAAITTAENVLTLVMDDDGPRGAL